MASPTDLTSPAHLTTLSSTHPLTIIDFHATWCGPCHAIAPFYSSLSTKYSSPRRIIFTKCDVDAQSAIARQYSVTAMPTFVILHKGKEVARIRGADKTGLGREVEKWVGEVKKSGGFTGGGQVLGGSPAAAAPSASTEKKNAGAAAPSYIRGGQAMTGIPLDAQIARWMDWIVLVVMCYFTSLFSFDPMGACEGLREGRDWEGWTLCRERGGLWRG
ncbi:thioredoxin-like protein [Kalaharituber pfeilii]|nr:thioredoxin-like protein [Kalaharituber pfeilii]